MASETKRIVRANVLALLRHQAEMRPGESGVTRIKALGLTQGTAQRLLDDESDLRMEAIDQLAKGLGIQSWQLLMPNLDPESLPQIARSDATKSADDELLATIRSLGRDERLKAAAYLDGLRDKAALGESSPATGTHNR